MPDPKLKEEVKQQIVEMERKQQEMMSAMMKQIEEQNRKREEEMRIILEEKNRQIEMLRSSEEQKHAIANSLKEIFKEERVESSKQLKEFFKSFQNEQQQ